MSTYFPSIPQATDRPSDSQALILSNFEALNNMVSRNHTPMSDTANSGKHEFLQMPQQTSAPSTGADEGGLYTKDVSGSTELFYREESDGAERQITSAFTAATNGFATLPGGLTFQWGRVNGVGNGDNVNFTTPFNAVPFNVQLTIIQQSAAENTIFVRPTGLTASKFVISTTAGALDIYWFAIGTL